MMSNNDKGRGFTLAEMAVVLVIVALLLGGLLAPLSSQTEMRQRTDNEKTLSDIREAIIGFAIVNGRLPCPANRSLASGAAGAGIESVVAVGGPCACTAAGSGIAGAGATCNDTAGASPAGVVGTLPWATLGLPETDAWNNRYTYRMTARFGRVANGPGNFGCTTPPNPNPPINPTNAAFALCTPGDSTVTVSSGGTNSATGLPAIVVSHGKNGLAAWLPTGAQAAVAGISADESENADDDATFVSNTNIDDQLVWISPNILMNRMIAAGKLP